MKRVPLLFANAFKSVNERQLYCCRNSFKSNNYMGSNTEEKPWTNLQNSYKNLSKEIKSVNFCYCKVGRAITNWGAIEKSPILLSQYWKNYHFQWVNFFSLAFWWYVAILFSPSVYQSNVFMKVERNYYRGTPKMQNDLIKLD